ncbi:MAG: S26 family signal peptidase [Planctomycetota bacterium]
MKTELPDPLSDREAALRALGSAPSEDDLRAFLRREDRASYLQALEDAKTLEAGSPCPVTEARRSAHASAKKKGAVLRLQATKSPINVLGPLLARPELSAEGADEVYAARPNVLGRAVGLSLGAAVVIVGMLVIFAGQEAETGQARLFAIGGALFLGGMGFITQVNLLFNQTAVGRKIFEARRVARDGQRFEPPKPTWLQHNLKEVVVAAVLFLIVRQFAAEAFVIPTGSMAPTLYGNHFRVDCPACGFSFAFGKQKSEAYARPVPLQVECPTCHHLWEYSMQASGVVGGSKILVNKLAYLLRPLERYEVAVFQFPEEPWNNYIKRIVGLPGEKLAIVNGDVYADDVVTRKPDDVQDSVWLPVYDSEHLDPAAEREWVGVNDTRSDAWALSEDRTRLTCTPQERPCTLRLRREVQDFCGYNQLGSQRYGPVGDQRLLATVDLAAGATLRLGARCGRTVWGRFVGGSAQATFAIEVQDAQGAPRAVEQIERPGLSGPTEVVLAYADLRARLIVDGETVLTWEDPAAAPIDRLSDKDLQAYSLLEVSGGEARFTHLKVDRDIYYRSWGAIDPLASDEYFACGDNSPNSLDSREWGPLTDDHLLGRAILVWYPIPDWGFIR